MAKVSQILLAKVGLAKVGFGQSRSNKDGQSRSNFSGQSRFGQSRIWPKSANKDGQSRIGQSKVGFSPLNTGAAVAPRCLLVSSPNSRLDLVE